MNYLFWLLIELKHFVCDYCFQTRSMYYGKRALSGWLFPLLRHAGTNAAGTLVVVLCLTQSVFAAVVAGIIDLVFHSVIDRAKIHTEKLFGSTIATALDQSLHQATFGIVWILFF